MKSQQEPYEKMSDEELIRSLREGNSEITDFIMEKYKNLVRKRANAMYLIGGETEDLIQEGMIGLFKAVRDYNEEKEASFYHFADLCISRQIYNAVEASQRKKHQPLNSYVSLDISGKDRENEIALLDVLKVMETSDPEQMVIDRENVQLMVESANQMLSKMEKTVLGLYLQGLNYQQIAEVMNKPPKSIDNALSRIKRKLSRMKVQE